MGISKRLSTLSQIVKKPYPTMGNHFLSSCSAPQPFHCVLSFFQSCTFLSSLQPSFSCIFYFFIANPDIYFLENPPDSLAISQPISLLKFEVVFYITFRIVAGLWEHILDPYVTILNRFFFEPHSKAKFGINYRSNIPLFIQDSQIFIGSILSHLCSLVFFPNPSLTLHHSNAMLCYL